MRSPNLGTGLLALVLTAGVVAPAVADPGGPAGPADPGTPSAGDVQAARERAAAATSDVEVVEERLAAANAELEAASVRAAHAAEAWNGARWQARRARSAERKAVSAALEADRALAVQKDDYRDAVITAHNAGLELSTATALITADGMESLLEQTAATDRVRALFEQQREEYDAAATTAETAAEAATEATEAAEEALATARAARDEAEARADAATATATRIATRKARLVRTLARLQGVSVAVAERRQDALAAEQVTARAAAAATPEPAPDPDPVRDPAPEPDPEPNDPEPNDPAPNDPAPAPSGGARAAIAYARAQLGEPYRWGADGPGSWDCSGLTAKAWAAGGRSLPHYSVAQYDVSTPIRVGQLRPGDLVFWGDNASPSSIFHVALYVGDGRIIHAPRTGRPVTEESMYYWRTPDFYARP